MTRRLIVGVDSGTTKAVALVSLDGSYYETYSEKNASFSDMCNFIVHAGSPLIVCSDRRESKLARKLAAAFSCRLCNPDKDLGVKEKRSLIGHCSRNTHEKDALAAALHGKKRYSRLFTKIESKLRKRNMLSLSSQVKELLVRRKAQNISHAIEISKKIGTL